ncbi:hypothetical protein BAE44_0022449 [Dichanthelium oligosanthes]|uniref:F-box domain-containing protein n=1 Tax=Dichanthelium oligosanthes TaxID=888268 RepID=A0A1E5UUK3_9POAL|nr:hypothetical protein BAE44_0022449 [Dichanthelium oligosanthes]
MALPEELVEEVLLRFPPAEPAMLVRAALVSKPWYRIVSAPRFRRRFREFHRTPPVLALFCNFRDQDGEYVTRVAPTSRSSPLRAVQVYWRALDARHGRVLLRGMTSPTDSHPGEAGRHLLVCDWDPITFGRCLLPPALTECHAAVLCAAGDACDHLDCHGGPFIVVALGPGIEAMWLCVYSSDSGSWSEPIHIAPAPEYGISVKPAALVGNALYFAIDRSRSILRYDLATRETSVMHHLPPESWGRATVLMTMEDGGLGVARADRATARLSLWKMEASPNGDIGWTEIRAIELGNLLPVDALPISSGFVGFAHGIGAFFVEADDGRIFSYVLKTGQVEMVCKGNGFHSVVPYMSFYVPGTYFLGL